MVQTAQEKFISEFKARSYDQKTLDLRGMDLTKKSGNELAEGFTAISSSVETLCLYTRDLAKMPVEELIIAFKGIPANVKTLVIMGNGLCIPIELGLARLFAAIPEEVRTLRIHGNLIDDEFVAAIAYIPKSVDTLDLNETNMGFLKNKLASIFQSIQETITTLHLDCNYFYRLSNDHFISALKLLVLSKP